MNCMRVKKTLREDYTYQFYINNDTRPPLPDYDCFKIVMVTLVL